MLRSPETWPARYISDSLGIVDPFNDPQLSSSPGTFGWDAKSSSSLQQPDSFLNGGNPSSSSSSNNNNNNNITTDRPNSSPSVSRQSVVGSQSASTNDVTASLEDHKQDQLNKQHSVMELLNPRPQVANKHFYFNIGYAINAYKSGS